MTCHLFGGKPSHNWMLLTYWYLAHIMMTSSNGNIFSVTGPLCGKFTGHRWISPHKGQWRGALMFSLICALNKRMSKQSWGWWFETPSHSLRRHYNEVHTSAKMIRNMKTISFKEKCISNYRLQYEGHCIQVPMCWLIPPHVILQTKLKLYGIKSILLTVWYDVIC